MRKVILSLATSLDGFIEGPNGETDWMTFSEETAGALGEFLEEIDTILYGRISYQKWGAYIPPDSSPLFEKEFYRKTGSMKKIVFSKSKTVFSGNPTVVSSGISGFINGLKPGSGKNLWLYGGSNLMTEFMNLGLIDELRIAVMPVVLGSGKPLFSQPGIRMNLELLKAKAGKSGVVELHYKTAAKQNS